ncbi:MAG: gliding motility-associated C-terminal domain-containing protein [Bacteroidota bacterium]
MLKPSLLALCLCIAGSISAQEYFRLLDQPENSFRRKVARFPNGDVLIGNSSEEALFSMANGKILMTRMDPCGVVRWSQSYEREGEYLKFADFDINSRGEIFIYGSAFSGLSELIFLLKLNSLGEVLAFRHYDPQTIDHFTYSCDMRGDQLMVYGLILGFGTQKQGFLAIFNSDLRFQWAKTFSPFESEGEAIFTNDGGFLCSSGPFLYKLDGNGALQWASTLSSTLGSFPAAGPLEVPGGYIFEFNRRDSSFFYKLNGNGNLDWTSDLFPASKYGASMTLEPDGRLFATYNCPGQDENQLCQLMVSPSGVISEQKQLDIDLTIYNGPLYHSIDDNQFVTLVANGDPLYINRVDVSDFIMQFAQEEASSDCFTWEPFSSLTNNRDQLLFQPLDTTVLDYNFVLQNLGKVIEFETELPYQEHCERASGQLLTQLDTFLNCEFDWMVELPSEDFQWEDEYPDRRRILEDPGLYKASNQDCAALRLFEYRLEKPPCDCDVYLPNAFSPNQDGINDELQLYSACEVVEMRMSIYDRWGVKVFEGFGQDIRWNGRFNNTPLKVGVYVAIVEYQLVNNAGDIQESMTSQDITLLR